MNTETIKNRKSVRTYEEQQIPEQTMRQIREFLNQDDNPFGVPITFSILDADKDGVSSPVILGAHAYVAGKYKKQKNAEIAFGYSFEKFILYATSLGLGTVWLAATIDRKAFEKAVNLGEDEVMPAVTPLGYAAQKRSLRENLMRKGMKSDQRLPYETLFLRATFSIRCRKRTQVNGQGLLPWYVWRLPQQTSSRGERWQRETGYISMK